MSLRQRFAGHLVRLKSWGGPLRILRPRLEQSALDHWTLRLMDWVGNRAYGVALPYAHLSGSEWQDLYKRLGVAMERTECDAVAPGFFIGQSGTLVSGGGDERGWLSDRLKAV
jgi:hypothetical protein